MAEIQSRLAEHDLDVGDRVFIQPSPRLLPALVGQVGTVAEVFRVPRDSCMVRIAGDPDRKREWFFYRDEVVIDNVYVGATEEFRR